MHETSDAGALIGRILLALIFVLSGFGKIVGSAGTAQMMAAQELQHRRALHGDEVVRADHLKLRQSQNAARNRIGSRTNQGTRRSRSDHLEGDAGEQVEGRTDDDVQAEEIGIRAQLFWRDGVPRFDHARKLRNEWEGLRRGSGTPVIHLKVAVLAAGGAQRIPVHAAVVGDWTY